LIDSMQAAPKLDPVTLLVEATLPVKITVAILVLASTYVWLTFALKSMQLRRLRADHEQFEKVAATLVHPQELMALAGNFHGTAAGRVVAALGERPLHAPRERLLAAVDRALVSERQRAQTLVTPLGTIASISPFVGLFGTVYGIMDAFVRIGNEKSASLPVVAPAIGEALITTAIGLACAIPAVAVYNSIDKRLSDYLDELQASSAEWVALFVTRPVDHQRPADPNAAFPQGRR
jgi:biopolymer transport protein TolQ